MNTFLQFFTEGRKPKFSQEIEDKIVAYKKEDPGITLYNIAKIFNTSARTVINVLDKRWPDWRKYSTVLPRSQGHPKQRDIINFAKNATIIKPSEIARKFGLTSPGVSSILDNHLPNWREKASRMQGNVSKAPINDIVLFKQTYPNTSIEYLAKGFKQSGPNIHYILNKYFPGWQKTTKTTRGRKLKHIFDENIFDENIFKNKLQQALQQRDLQAKYSDENILKYVIPIYEMTSVKGNNTREIIKSGYPQKSIYYGYKVDAPDNKTRNNGLCKV